MRRFLSTNFIRYHQPSLFTQATTRPSVLLSPLSLLFTTSPLRYDNNSQPKTRRLDLNAILYRPFSVKADDSDSKTTQQSTTTPTTTTKGRFMELWSNYGVVFIGTYGTMYLVFLGSIFELVTQKYVDAGAAVKFMHSLGIDKFMDLTPITQSKLGNFALAWVLCKFTEPLRLALTVTITPTIARYLGRAPPKKHKEK